MQSSTPRDSDSDFTANVFRRVNTLKHEGFVLGDMDLKIRENQSWKQVFVEKLNSLDSIGEGHSGANVYKAEIFVYSQGNGAKWDRAQNIVIKVDRAAERPSIAEFDNAVRAWSDIGPPFRKHISKPLFQYTSGAGLVIGSQVAGMSLIDVRTLGAIQSPSDFRLLEAVVNGVVGLYQRIVRSEVPFENRPLEVLETWLGYRLKTKRIEGFLEQDCSEKKGSVDSSCEGIEVDNEDALRDVRLPNPIAYCTNEALWSLNKTAKYYLGPAHCDLNVNNVLANPREPKRYTIIDWASYNSACPFFFDIAYLELSFLLSRSPSQTLSTWARYCESAMNLGQDLNDSNPTGQLVTRWLGSRGEYDTLKNLFVLSRVAAGLSIAHWKGDGRTRFLAVLWAAFALREYMRRIDMSHGGGVRRVAHLVSPKNSDLNVERSM